MFSQQALEDSRDPAHLYLDKLRKVELEEICRELIVVLFRLTARDVYRRRSTRATAALYFLRGPHADYLADLIGLDASAITREALRLQAAASWDASLPEER